MFCLEPEKPTSTHISSLNKAWPHSMSLSWEVNGVEGVNRVFFIVVVVSDWFIFTFEMRLIPLERGVFAPLYIYRTCCVADCFLSSCKIKCKNTSPALKLPSLECEAVTSSRRVLNLLTDSRCSATRLQYQGSTFCTLHCCPRQYEWGHFQCLSDLSWALIWFNWMVSWRAAGLA